MLFLSYSSDNYPSQGYSQWCTVFILVCLWLQCGLGLGLCVTVMLMNVIYCMCVLM